MFKHHYFVIAQVREYWNVSKKYMFIHCRAKDVQKTVLDNFAEGAEVGIESVSKLD
jgi:hypothetical protein